MRSEVAPSALWQVAKSCWISACPLRAHIPSFDVPLPVLKSGRSPAPILMAEFGDGADCPLLSKGGCYRPFIHLPTFDNFTSASWSLGNPDVTPESRSLEHFTTSSGLLNITIKQTLSRTGKCSLMNCMRGSGIRRQPQAAVTWSSFAFEMDQDDITTINASQRNLAVR